MLRARRGGRRRLLGVGGHPAGVDVAGPAEQLGGLGARRQGAPGQRSPAPTTRGASRRRRARRPCVGGGEVELGGEHRGRQGGAPDQHARAPGCACAASSRTRRVPVRALLGQLADLGAREQQHVVGDVPHRVGGADQRVGVPRDGGARWCATAAPWSSSSGRAASATRNWAASGSPASSTTAARVPGGTAHLDREPQRRAGRRARRARPAATGRP